LASLLPLDETNGAILFHDASSVKVYLHLYQGLNDREPREQTKEYWWYCFRSLA